MTRTLQRNGQRHGVNYSDLNLGYSSTTSVD